MTTFGINLQKVVEADDFTSIVRMTALKLLKHPYLDVGTFLTELSQSDVSVLASWCNAITLKIDEEYMLSSIVLLGEMLAQAEGVVLNGDVTRTSNLMILLTFEDLARKGVITFNRKLATLGSDLEKIDGLAALKE